MIRENLVLSCFSICFTLHLSGRDEVTYALMTLWKLVRGHPFLSFSVAYFLPVISAWYQRNCCSEASLVSWFVSSRSFRLNTQYLLQNFSFNCFNSRSESFSHCNISFLRRIVFPCDARGELLSSSRKAFISGS